MCACLCRFEKKQKTEFVCSVSLNMESPDPGKMGIFDKQNKGREYFISAQA